MHGSIQRLIWNSLQHLQWSFFAKIVNGGYDEKLLTRYCGKNLNNRQKAGNAKEKTNKQPLIKNYYPVAIFLSLCLAKTTLSKCLLIEF